MLETSVKLSTVDRLARMQFSKPFGLDLYFNLFAFYAIGVRRSGHLDFCLERLATLSLCSECLSKGDGIISLGLVLVFLCPYVLYECHSVQPPTSIHPL